MPYPAILVDFDGVLRQWPDSDADTERAHGLPPGSIRRVAFEAPLVQALVTGRLSDTDWRAQTALRLRDAHPLADVDGAVARWASGLGQVNEPLLALLRRRLPGWRLVLVSNGSTRLEQDLIALDLIDDFDVVVNSSTIRLAKPDPEFFRIALQQADSHAGLAVFVDDSAEHVAAARALGISAHHYAQLEAARRFLADAGAVAA